MDISNLDMETRPSCKSFHYISAGKNINFMLIIILKIKMTILLLTLIAVAVNNPIKPIIL